RRADRARRGDRRRARDRRVPRPCAPPSRRHDRPAPRGDARARRDGRPRHARRAGRPSRVTCTELDATPTPSRATPRDQALATALTVGSRSRISRPDMAERLTLHDVSQRSGASVELLGELRELGLIGAAADAFGPEDVPRVRLIRLLLRRGVTLERLAEAERTGSFLGPSLEYLSKQGEGWPTYSLAQVGERIGVEPGVLRRFVEAAGLGGGDDQ